MNISTTTLSAVSLPTLLMGASTIAFLILERVRPGRELPHSQGWYLRAVLINLAQLGITLATARVWIKIFGAHSLLHLSHWGSPLAQGFVNADHSTVKVPTSVVSRGTARSVRTSLCSGTLGNRAVSTATAAGSFSHSSSVS
jgi:hypothetical protein